MEPLDEAPERRVKDRLRRYRDLLDEIDMQEQRLDQMRADMGGLKSPSYDGMPKGESDPDGVHRKAMLAVRLEEAIRAARLREESERDDLERMVSRMPRAMERMVLRLRYFDRMPWDDVAFAMYGDRADFLDCEPEYRRKVYRRHTEAVLSLALVDAKEAIVRRSA